MQSVARVGCVLVLLAAACGGLGKRHSSGLPSDQVAEVRGVEDPYTILGMELHLSFTAVEGKEFDEGQVDIVELLPGHHTLRCHYTLSADSQPVTADTKDVELDVEAGRVYQAGLAHDSKAGWHVVFEVVKPGESGKETPKPADGKPTSAASNGAN